MIVYIWGDDTFRSRQYLRGQVENFKRQRDPGGYNVVRLDGMKEPAGKILGELLSAPFLAEKRLVVIDNILSSGDEELLAGLSERIKQKKIPESTVALFWQGESAGKKAEVKVLQALLQKEKYSPEFALLKGRELSAWAGKEISTRGGKIAPAALEYLCQNAGGEMWLLNSLIDQLINYKNGEEISYADVELFLEEKADENIFNMVDAVVAGNAKLAFKLMDDQRRLGKDDGYLFSMILRQFRILLEIRDLFEREENARSEELAKRLGMHPFVVKKSLPLVRRYTMERLRGFYRELLDIDIKTKTGPGNQGFLIELLAARAAVISLN